MVVGIDDGEVRIHVDEVSGDSAIRLHGMVYPIGSRLRRMRSGSTTRMLCSISSGSRLRSMSLILSITVVSVQSAPLNNTRLGSIARLRASNLG
jgi:hypothetical protein